MTAAPSLEFEVWLPVKDGDRRAWSLFQDHYSRYIYADGRRPRLFVGPGEKMVLLTQECDALFVWRMFQKGGLAQVRRDQA